MKFTCFISAKNGKKAEDILKKDDLASRGSIVLRDAKVLGIEKEGYFLFYEGSEEAVKRVKELINEFTEVVDAELLKKAEKEFEKESEKALRGFGEIFG